MTTPRSPSILQVGGTVYADRHIYITRQDIEDDLYDSLGKGEYCNILSSRQIGKSSIMSNVALRLRDGGSRVAVIDVAGTLGSPEKAVVWYQALLGKVASELGLKCIIDQWWDAQKVDAANLRFLRFFRDEILSESVDPVVIFVDEIDSTLSLDYTDDFFTAIRTMYNERGLVPAYRKITFCLVGVASPNELIKDRRTTPYNIGKSLEIRYFDSVKDDLSLLRKALSKEPEIGDQLLNVILQWTDGHPYLTLFLCEKIIERQLRSGAEVAKLMEQHFSNVGIISSDVHFQQVTKFLGSRVEDKFSALKLYKRIFPNKNLPDETTSAHIELKLSGLIRRNQEGNIFIANKIYQKVFNQEWLERELDRLDRHYKEDIKRWLESGKKSIDTALTGDLLEKALSWAADRDDLSDDEREFLEFSRKYNSQLFDEKQKARELKLEAKYGTIFKRLSVVLLILSILAILIAFYAGTQRKLAEEQEAIAISNAKIAEENARKAQQQEVIAIENAQKAEDAKLKEEKQRKKAEEAKLKEEKQRKLAEANEEKAKIQEAIAIVNAKNAELAKNEEEKQRKIAEENEREAQNQEAIANTNAESTQKQKLKANKLKNAFRFASLALENNEYDPTIALRLAQEAWEIKNEIIGNSKNSGGTAASEEDKKTFEVIDDTIYRIYRENEFYSAFIKTKESSAVSVLSSNQKETLVRSNHNNVELRDLEGYIVSILVGHEKQVTSAVFSANADSILTGSDDHTARLWDRNGNEKEKYIGHDGTVRAVAFDHEGKFVLTGSDDYTVRLWDRKNGKQIRKFIDPDSPVYSVAFDLTNKIVAVYANNKSVRIWNQKGRLESGFKLTLNNITCAEVSPNGQSILTGSSDGVVRLFDINSKLLKSFRAHDTPISTVLFSNDGRVIFTRSEKNVVIKWKLMGNMPQTLKGHQGSVIAVAYHPNRNLIVSGSSDNTVKIWDLNEINEPKTIAGFSGAVRSVTFGPDYECFLVNTSKGPPQVFDLEGKGIPDEKDKFKSVPLSPIQSVKFAADGNFILIKTDDGSLELLSKTGEVQKRFHDLLRGPVQSAIFSPDGESIIAGFNNGKIRSWNLNDNSTDSFEFSTGVDARVVETLCSPSGKVIATLLGYKILKLWELNGSIGFGLDKKVDIKLDQDTKIRSIAFSPNGKLILTGSDDALIRLWNLDGRLLRVYRGHQGPIRSIAIENTESQDKDVRFVSGSEDKTVRIWTLDKALPDFLESDDLAKLTSEQKEEFGIQDE